MFTSRRILLIGSMIWAWMAQAQTELPVKILEQPVVIDGLINPNEWLTADSVSGFFSLRQLAKAKVFCGLRPSIAIFLDSRTKNGGRQFRSLPLHVHEPRSAK